MSVFTVVIYLVVIIESILGVPRESRQTPQGDEIEKIRMLTEMLQTYGQRIEKLEKGNQQLMKLTENLENRNREWESKTEDLEIRNKELESRTNVLEKRSKELESRMEIIERSTIQEMLETGDKEGSSDDPPNKHVTENPEFQSVKNHLTGGGNEFSRIRKVAPSQDNAIGFYATMTKMYVNLATDQTLKFDNVITNVGNGYDVRTGHFNVPKSGLYFFSATILHISTTKSDGAMYTAIVKNGSPVGVLYAHETYDNGSRSVVLYLDVGDHVWVHNEVSTETIDGSRFCTFSGFLISK